MIRASAPLQRINPRWPDATVVVAATGPSLTPEVAALVKSRPARTIAVNDAYRLLPFADVLYACDAAWWEVHRGCPGFAGERWSSHSDGTNDKLAVAEKYGIRLVEGREAEGFSYDPARIHYGSNSGFQALNLAILFGAARIVLVGYDMRGNGHFFGRHPSPLITPDTFERFVPYYTRAAATLPARVRVLNATPGSALDCFPAIPLEEAL